MHQIRPLLNREILRPGYACGFEDAKSANSTKLFLRRPLVYRGEDQAWEQGGLIQGQGFENVGEQTYIWYGTWDPGSLEQG